MISELTPGISDVVHAKRSTFFFSVGCWDDRHQPVDGRSSEEDVVWSVICEGDGRHPRPKWHCTHLVHRSVRVALPTHYKKNPIYLRKKSVDNSQNSKSICNVGIGNLPTNIVSVGNENSSRWDSKPSLLSNVHRSFNHYTSQILLSMLWLLLYLWV